MGILEGEGRRKREGEKERKKGAENLYGEIIAENFPNLWKEMDIHIQKA